MIGLFAIVTRKISLVTGILGMITGIILPVFSSLIPDTIIATSGLSLACILFFVISYRLLFMGLTVKERKPGQRNPRKTKPVQ
jgi:hypothetical protein